MFITTIMQELETVVPFNMREITYLCECQAILLGHDS